VDSAILSLTSARSTSPETHYYGRVNNSTTTDLLLQLASDGREDQVLGGENVREAAIQITPTTRPPEYAPQVLFGTATPPGTATPQLALSTQTAQELPDTGGGGGGAFAANAAPPAPSASEEESAARSRDGDAGAVDVRGDFQQTPLWAAHVMTDAAGRAQVTVTMPDNLTIWNLTARAVTADTLIGEMQLDIASTLPLLVRPAVPRFFIVNDEVTLGMVINNNTDQPQALRAQLQGSGYTLVAGTMAEQTVTVAPNSRARVDWRVQIQDVTGVDLTFIAIGSAGFQDASKPPLTDENGLIPVYRYIAPDTVGTSGVVAAGESRLEGVIVPATAVAGTLTVKVEHSLAATTLDALSYVRNYPHQCIEQTVSRFLPNLSTWRALQQLNVTNDELDANLTSALDFAVGKLLLNQNYDGGWGWFPQLESNPMVSAYALFGLVQAREYGYAIPEGVLQRAIAYVRSQITLVDTDSNWWELNRQAFFFYVLAAADVAQVSTAELDRLLAYRVEMSLAARAYLLMTYVRVGDSAAQSATLSSDLRSAALVSATGAHWEETALDWWNWGSDVRTTSLVLMALLQVNPTDELLPNVVRWLMIARQGDHWASTQETTWAVMALTDWMVATQELEGNYRYSIAVNNVTATEGQVTPATIREGALLTIDVQDLLLDALNQVTISRDAGQGSLYYTAHLQLKLDASEVTALNRGIGVQREFLINGQNVTAAQVGDIITVRLTVNVPETIYYAVIEAPIPAGTEIMDYTLQTTARADRPTDPRYFWQSWYWDHRDTRDETVNLYADVLYPGTYIYSYEIRASVAGTFQVLPAHAFAFYFPEVFGRSAGGLFTVR
jgi:hypothetical protein